MMSIAKLTLIGLNNYFPEGENNIFAKMTLPEGIDKDVLVDNIMLRGGEFEVLYSNPTFLRDAIGIWSNKWSRTFSKWVEALSIEYNPLENYDRNESWIEIGNSNASDQAQGTTANKISAYNSNTMQDDTSSAVSNSTSGTAHSDNTHTGRIHGNIGVTTSQQMLQSELDIAKWNLYDQITDLFLGQFVIPIY